MYTLVHVRVYLCGRIVEHLNVHADPSREGPVGPHYLVFFQHQMTGSSPHSLTLHIPEIKKTHMSIHKVPQQTV